MRQKTSFAEGCVHSEFSRLWKEAVLWREDQQLQKPPGGSSMNHEGCTSLSVTHTMSSQAGTVNQSQNCSAVYVGYTWSTLIFDRKMLYKHNVACAQ